MAGTPLYDTPVAVLTPALDFRIRLEWSAAGIDRWGLGSPVLSVGLRIGSVVGPRDLRGLDFFENMLPEGSALTRMAAMAGVRPVDTYGILAAFGRDCAGAVMLLPDGEQPDGNMESGYSAITSGDLRGVISELDVAPLGAAPERGFRPSLAGFQRKVLLGRAADGTWQLPFGDAPSTWILKPDGPHPMAVNEVTCLRLTQTAAWQCRKLNCWMSKGCQCWPSSDMTDGSLPVGTFRIGYIKKMAARQQLGRRARSTKSKAARHCATSRACSGISAISLR